MTIILTLLCRDEADIIASTVEFHLSRGVDLILATDNGSGDGTTAILERYERQGVLRLFREPAHTHDQAVWVSRMARLAAEQYAASWVIHCDADEFWWPGAGSYQAEFARVPADVMALQVRRVNFLPPPPEVLPGQLFHQVQTIRERESRNNIGELLPAKVCHRGDVNITVTDGNHEVLCAGEPVETHFGLCDLEILHFPVRSYQQLERKIRQGAEALARNNRIPPHVGITWKLLYEEQLQAGTLPEHYRSLRPEPEALESALANGDLVEDRRLQLAFAAPASPASVTDPAAFSSEDNAMESGTRRFAGRLAAITRRLLRHEQQPGLPRVAVITPYYREDLALLRQCHRSVRAQTMPCLHVLVADGRPRRRLNFWNAHHIVLPVSHGDIGSTPRLIGANHAIGLGVEAVAFLDADNWYEPDHIAGLMALCDQEGAGFVSSSRLLCRLDGTPMASCPLTDPERFIDTNCMLFGREAFPLLHHWVLMPEYGHLIGDRIMFHHVRSSGVRRCHLPTPSVHYRCGKEGLYRQLGESVPAGVSPRPDYERSIRLWLEDGFPPLL